MNLFSKIYKFLFITAVCFTAAACQDDIDFRTPTTNVEDIEPGLPTTVSLSVKVDAPIVRSRAAEENKITSLWVSIYSAEYPYERTGYYYVTNFNDGIDDDHGSIGSNDTYIPEEKLHKIDITCRTGKSYIVAVANFIGVKGMVVPTGSNNDDVTWDPKLLGDKGANNRYISAWLQESTHLTRFMSICGMRASIGDNSSTTERSDISIDEPTNGHIMAGNFHFTNAIGQQDHSIDMLDMVVIDSEGHIHNEDGSVVVNDQNRGAGAIHLRRLLAENKFEISFEEDVVDMEIIDIEVFNLPKYAWLYSRENTGLLLENLNMANAGDAIELTDDDIQMTEEEKALNHPYFQTSLRYTPPSGVTESVDGNGKKKYTFTFWQAENKRTGIIPKDKITTDYNSNYALRQVEYKNTDGTNTGIYTSLSPQGGDVNNNATYVLINANVTYKIDDNFQNPDELKDNDVIANPSEVKTRTAQTKYIVHVGYVKDSNGNADPNDFNCYRNSKYTYNINIRSANKVMVEAFKEGEYQPSAEGTVTDVTQKFFELDAHNGVFNIYMTKEELKSFSFVMRSYYDGKAHTITYDNTDPTNSNVPTSTTSDDWKYYDWIEIVPTGQTVSDPKYETAIATYPGYGKKYHPTSEPKGVLYLKDLVDNAEYLDGQWFTVYVNEYTYEIRDPKNSNYGNETVGVSGTDWKKYVGQPNRNAWFNVSMSQSSDLESEYFKAKYALTQKSIQSIYNLMEDNSGTGFGLEHDNESFGMNLRWVNAPKTFENGKLSNENGRYNVWEALKEDKSIDEDNRLKWSACLNLSSMQSVNNISNGTQVSSSGIATAAKVYNVLKQEEVTVSGELWYDGLANDYDPQPDGSTIQYIEIMYACLNRNRDENGDGKIDEKELKWYVPTSGKYVQTILGRSSLPSPLMEFSQVTLPNNSGSDYNTLYHFATSDAKKMWLDEGMSSSDLLLGYNSYNHAPWQVRCVRNFGINLADIQEELLIENAYVDNDIDKNSSSSSYLGGIIVPKHYYGSALRAPVVNPILPHKVSSRQNNISYYGFEIAPHGNVFSTGKRSDGKSVDFYSTSSISDKQYAVYVEYIKNATPCANLNTITGRSGWRLPNQREAIIMMRAGTVSEGRYVTCTQEHWANFGNSFTSGTLDGNHRLATVLSSSTEKIGTCAWHVSNVRCVRDLTEDEYGMTYEQVKNYKTGE